MVIKYIFLVFLQVDLHKIAKSMNFYHDINSGTFLNIRSHRVDGSSPNHTYIVRIYVNPHNIILIMYAYLCASSLNYTYIVRILVCILTKSYFYCMYTCVYPYQIILVLYTYQYTIPFEGPICACPNIIS